MLRQSGPSELLVSCPGDFALGTPEGQLQVRQNDSGIQFRGNGTAAEAVCIGRLRNFLFGICVRMGMKRERECAAAAPTTSPNSERKDGREPQLARL